MRNFTFEPGDEKVYVPATALTPKRQEALDAIALERQYQVEKWGFWDDRMGAFEARKQPSQFLYYAEGYMDEAKQLLARKSYADARRDVCLIAMKVAALMTALMEQHGVETR